MAADSTRTTMERYLDDLAARGDFGRYFADDVRLTIEGTDQAADGPEAVEGLIRYLHELAFDGTMEVRGLIVEPGKAVLEADFVGRHTGEFAGVAATGREVRVPYAVVYELDADRIRALRIYLAPEQIVARLTAGAATAGVSATH